MSHKYHLTTLAHKNNANYIHRYMQSPADDERCGCRFPYNSCCKQYPIAPAVCFIDRSRAMNDGLSQHSVGRVVRSGKID